MHVNTLYCRQVIFFYLLQSFNAAPFLNTFYFQMFVFFEIFHLYFLFNIKFHFLIPLIYTHFYKVYISILFCEYFYIIYLLDSVVFVNSILIFYFLFHL